MISIELWRSRIGGWGGKGRLPRACDETHNFYPITKQADPIIALSCCLLVVVIRILLVIGGVELNPGPTGGDPNASTSEDFSSETGNYLYYLIFKEIYMTFWHCLL